jgi:MFS family permease
MQCGEVNWSPLNYSQNIACFLANADETFVLSTGSDVASALNASGSASWLITSYNLGYTVGLPVVS